MELSLLHPGLKPDVSPFLHALHENMPSEKGLHRPWVGAGVTSLPDTGLHWLVELLELKISFAEFYHFSGKDRSTRLERWPWFGFVH